MRARPDIKCPLSPRQTKGGGDTEPGNGWGFAHEYLTRPIPRRLNRAYSTLCVANFLRGALLPDCLIVVSLEFNSIDRFMAAPIATFAHQI